MNWLTQLFRSAAVIHVGVALLWLIIAPARAAETNAPEPATNVSLSSLSATNAAGTNAWEADRREAEQALRDFLKLQEQIHAERLHADELRQDGPAAGEALKARLEALERGLQAQRERDDSSARDSNRTLLIVATLFAAVGLVTLVCTALFQMRAIQQLTEVVAASVQSSPFPPPAPALPVLEEPRLLAAGTPSRLMEVIGRLEQRVRELETGSAPALSLGRDTANGQAAADFNGDSPALLAKGQTLLNLGRAAEALECFERVLAAEPANAEAWWRKGLACERLQRLDDALAAYDGAIGAEHTFTRAYLAKGGVLHQQERFREALVCYEQALQARPRQA